MLELRIFLLTFKIYIETECFIILQIDLESRFVTITKIQIYIIVKKHGKDCKKGLRAFRFISRGSVLVLIK